MVAGPGSRRNSQEEASGERYVLNTVYEDDETEADRRSAMALGVSAFGRAKRLTAAITFVSPTRVCGQNAGVLRGARVRGGVLSRW